MSRQTAIALLALVAGCSVGTYPSEREMQAAQEAQMQGAAEMIESQMQGVQDMFEGKDTEAARAMKQRSETMARQGEEMERQARQDPRYARIAEQEERERREFMRRNPSGVESEFNLSDSEEANLGFGMAEQFLSNQKLVADERIQRYVNALGMWIAQQSERPGLPWRFAVIEGESPNAFAVPGGYIFVTRAMFDLIETESELAGILGHEVAHVVRKHHLRWIYMNKEFEVSLRQVQEGAGGNNPAYQRMLQSLGKVMERSREQMNSPQLRSGLSKSEEFQADTDGAVLAWRAGYESWGLAAVLQRFEAVSRMRQANDNALSDHPEPLQRFKMLDLALRSLPEVSTLGDTGTQRYLDAARSIRGPRG
jgi:predicted Zn-dependent protease